MINYRGAKQIAMLWAVLAAGSFASRADTIIAPSGNQTLAPGTLVNSLELMDFELDPNSFLFTGNTGYNYDGLYEVQMIGAEVDPSVTDSLDVAKIRKLLVTIGDTGGDGAVPGVGANGFVSSEAAPSAVPEPAFLSAAGIAMLVGWLGIRSGDRARGAH